MNDFENFETENLRVIDLEPETEVSDSKGGIALLVGGIAAVGALGALTYKKIKDKRKGKPRKKLMWVEVEPEEEEVEDEEFEFEDEDEN